jgi:hypothetical protein
MMPINCSADSTMQKRGCKPASARLKNAAPSMGKNVLVFRDQIVGLLYHALSTGSHGLSSVPGLLRRAILEDAWKERTVKATGETIPGFKTFREFVETVPPDGLGSTVDLIAKIIRDDPEVEEQFRKATTGVVGTNQHSDIITTLKPKRGTSRPYVLSRLKRDAPELFKRVVAGELSANAASIEAGFKIRLTPFAQIVKWIPKLTLQERRQITEQLERMP